MIAPLLMATLGVLTIYNSSVLAGKSSDTVNSEQLLRKEFQEALDHDIGIVDARLAVNDQGEQRMPDGFSRYNILPSRPLLGGEKQFAANDHTGVNVVYVHGYNTTATEGIQNGNKLWKLLTRSNNGLPNPPHMSLFTFLWHGDLGEAYFSRSQQTANISAKSLSEFLLQLRTQAPRAKTVVIAHSLGAQVALEALKGMITSGKCSLLANQALLDSLVLVQGAVAAPRLYSWKHSYKVETLYRVPMDEPYKVHEDSPTSRGTYFDSLHCTQHLLFTATERDHVLQSDLHDLMRWKPEPGFNIEEKLFPESPRLPFLPGKLQFTAIGTPIYFKEEQEVYGSLPLIEDPRHDIDLSRTQRTRELQDRTTPHQRVTLKWSDWKIGGSGNADSIHIDEFVKNPDSIKDNKWWHSPIYDERGWELINEIWKRVVGQIIPSR